LGEKWENKEETTGRKPEILLLKEVQKEEN
jgi:hypothetical protein